MTTDHDPIPNLVLLELHFRTLAFINDLPHYHGAQWSALFRNIFKSCGETNFTLDDAGIWIHPIETGIPAYEADEPIHLGLTFPRNRSSLVATVIEQFNSVRTHKGHFQPGVTICFEGAYSRFSGEVWQPDEEYGLSEDAIRAEVEALAQMDRFSLLLTSPLRVKRPEGQKRQGHSFCDEEYIILAQIGGDVKFMALIIQKVRPEDDGIVLSNKLRVTSCALTWLDVPYSKTLGGVVGCIEVAGRPSPVAARRLVMGQYTGCGKNPTFGLGFFVIPELEPVRTIQPLNRGRSLFEHSILDGPARGTFRPVLRITRPQRFLHRLPVQCSSLE